MLKILKVIRKNVVEGPSSVRLPESVPEPEGYRGKVILDISHCLACHTCAYVCVSEAITGGDEGTAYAWRYEPGRCTFCARCVDYCPGKALSMEGSALPSYDRLGELGVCELVPLPPCPECGTLTRPLTAELLNQAFEHVKEGTEELLRLCERCRRKRLQQGLFISAFDANAEEKK